MNASEWTQEVRYDWRTFRPRVVWVARIGAEPKRQPLPPRPVGTIVRLIYEHLTVHGPATPRELALQLAAQLPVAWPKRTGAIRYNLNNNPYYFERVDTIVERKDGGRASVRWRARRPKTGERVRTQKAVYRRRKRAQSRPG